MVEFLLVAEVNKKQQEDLYGKSYNYRDRDRETKAEYVENFEEKYLGHKVECTFFNYSDEGKPTQPRARIFRFDLE